MESIHIYALQPAIRKLIFETVRIGYNQPIRPEVFHLVLPENIKWLTYELPEVSDAAVQFRLRKGSFTLPEIMTGLMREISGLVIWTTGLSNIAAV